MVMVSELTSKSKRRKTTQHTSLKQKLIYISPWTNSFCEEFHKNMWPYYSRTNYQKVRDAYLTTLKASSTASFDVPPNYTYRLQPITCIHYNKQTQY